MSDKQFIRTKLSLSISLIIGSMLVSSAALAEEKASEERKIETIMVTAQKRVQSAQEVPMAITTVSQEELQNAGVTSISDIQVLVPSINVYTGAVPTMSAITLRGAGTGASDPTLQPSVGVFIDGVFMPRSVFGISDLVDIDRVEVLLGPQGTLYGKNTNSGVISVATKGAPDEFEFQGQVDVGNYDKTDGQFSLGYGLTDDLSFRIAGLVRKQDGYIDNLTTGDTLGNVDKNAFRGQIYWTPTSDISIRAIGYTSSSTGVRNVAETRHGAAEPFAGFILPGYVPFFPGTTINDFVDPDPTNRKVRKNMGDNLDPEVKSEGASVQLDWDLGGVSITSISAYQKWSQEDYFNDVDGTAFDIGGSVDNMSEKSFSQELRISSYGNETIDWVAGLFYFDSDLERGSADKNEAFSTYTLGLPGIPSGAAVAPFIPNLVNGGDYATWYNNYQTDSIAVFGQVNWHVSDKTEVTVGLRYGEESVDLDMSVGAYDVHGTQLTLASLFGAGGTTVYQGGSFIPLAGGIITEILPDLMKVLGNPADPSINWGAGPVSRSNSREDDDVTGMISVTHKLSDDIMLFTTVATGAKSGGFNGAFGALSNEQREFDQEKTTNYEIGLKMDLLDGDMRLNTSYFHTVYKDFQAASFVGETASFNVTNAGEQTTKGVDVDLIYLLSDTLTFNAKVEYLDATYGDFKNAACHKGADVKWVDQAAGICDLTGETLEFAPEWAGSISLDYIQEFGDGEVYANLNNSFKTDYFADPTRAPYAEVNFSLVNARIGWRSDNWDVSLWGKNLTDETYANAYSTLIWSEAAAGLFGQVSGDYQAFLNDPRTFGLTVRYTMQ